MSEPQTVESQTELNGSQRWFVRGLSLLLIIQVVIIVLSVVHYWNKVDWINDIPDTLSPTLIREIRVVALDSLTFIVVFAPLIFFTVLSIVGVFFVWRTGWVMTMIVEGFILFGCLMLYIERDGRILLLYPIMAYSTFMVLCLNSSAIRLAFHTKN